MLFILAVMGVERRCGICLGKRDSEILGAKAEGTLIRRTYEGETDS